MGGTLSKRVSDGLHPQKWRKTHWVLGWVDPFQKYFHMGDTHQKCFQMSGTSTKDFPDEWYRCKKCLQMGRTLIKYFQMGGMFTRNVSRWVVPLENVFPDGWYLYKTGPDGWYLSNKYFHMGGTFPKNMSRWGVLPGCFWGTLSWGTLGVLM